MLTFSDVLETFKDYIKEDIACEIVSTSRGHLFLLWDDVAKDWQDVVCCPTPEDLYEVLDENQTSYHEYLESKKSSSSEN